MPVRPKSTVYVLPLDKPMNTIQKSVQQTGRVPLFGKHTTPPCMRHQLQLFPDSSKRKSKSQQYAGEGNLAGVCVFFHERMQGGQT